MNQSAMTNNKYLFK